MINTMINQVVVTYDPELSMDEITAIVKEEVKLWGDKSKELARVEITLDGDDIIVKSVEKSPVRRVRRITGYLSNMENFNDAKQEELSQRYKHM